MRRLLWTRPKVSMSWLVMVSESRPRVDPFGGAVGPVLFLPDRHQFLEPVDGVAARLERLRPVRTADRHGHADLAHVHVPQAVDQGHLADGPALAGLALDLGHLLLG